jgi:hypothetical protein
MSTTEKYNGWHNYETWTVHLWLSNDQSSCDYWRSAARESWESVEADAVFSRSTAARFALADRLKEEIEAGDPIAEAEPSLYSQLLTAAISDVNWDEIADSFCDGIEGYKRAR